MGSNNKRYDYEYVKNKFKEKGYTLISTEYKNEKAKLNYFCDKHKDVGLQQVTFASLNKSSCNCIECKNENNNKKIGVKRNLPKQIDKYYDKYFLKYKEKLFDTVGDEYSLQRVESINRRTRLQLVHNICGSEYIVDQGKFFDANCRCQNPDCKYQRQSNRQIKTTEQFKKEVFDLVGDEYIIESIYSGKDNNIVFRHTICHCVFEKTPHNFLAGQRCPHCVLPTKGEQKILDCLNARNIQYTFQKTYSDLRGVNGGLLSYDMYLNDYNCLIEYQGHFHDGSAFKTYNEKFETQQEHDKRKREYAKSHGIDLLEIWYWDFDNIEKILADYLNLHNEKVS